MNRPTFCSMMGLVGIVAVFFSISAVAAAQYQPNWNSLDARPLPAWYDQSKFGIFIHWGVFSVPSYKSEWFWWYWKGTTPAPDVVTFMEHNFRPGFTYADFAPMFTAEFFNPSQWADIFKASGAKYVVLTSKHHEGFTNWPSKYSWNWNSMDVGPKRDLVGELAAAIRNRTDIHFGLYHSLFEWFNPLYNSDKANNFATQEYVEKVLMPELMEIINTYKPEVLWADGPGGGNYSYWNSTEFLAWLYNYSPVKDTVVTNDRWGKDTKCHHGGYFTCTDKYTPGHLVKHKWESCMTIDQYSWGYRRNAQLADFLDMDKLVELLVSTVSCNGNLLLNIGPTHDGRIVPIFEERLRSMGAWLNVNGDAIYETRPWRLQNDTISKGVWYTSKMAGNVLNVYAILLDWPANNQVTLGDPVPTTQTTVTMLGYAQQPLKWTGTPTKAGMNITLPSFTAATLPCQWAWTLKMQYVQ